MTYYELFTKAEYLLIKNKITLGEYHKMVQPLNEEMRKEGEWIDQGENLHKCSNCGHIIFSQTKYNLNEVHAFCGRCGARMKGE